MHVRVFGKQQFGTLYGTNVKFVVGPEHLAECFHPREGGRRLGSQSGEFRESCSLVVPVLALQGHSQCRAWQFSRRTGSFLCLFIFWKLSHF